ncbi:MAG: hypothetical protein J6O41_06600 [Clostridia bacterium]|nr:hypothetical protein [Clostridia bacterium]
MEKLTNKIVVITLIIALALLIIPKNVFAALTSENVQIVKTDSNYIIYVEGMEEKDFTFASSDTEEDPNSISLNYVNAPKDDNGNGSNSVAVLTQEAKYLYIKDGENASRIELDFTKAIDQSEISNVEDITNIIEAETTTINKRDEQIDQVKYKLTVGGLKITDDQDASYEYVSVKLPNDAYDTLKEMTNKLDTEYENKTAFEKVKFAKEYSDLLNNLINSANWNPVENMLVSQPDDAQNGDEYIVLLKQTKGQEVKYDVKILTSLRTEEAPQQQEETVVTKRTSRLPITGDNLILFAVLAVIVLALVVVFIRIKKLQDKGKH